MHYKAGSLTTICTPAIIIAACMPFHHSAEYVIPAWSSSD